MPSAASWHWSAKPVGPCLKARHHRTPGVAARGYGFAPRSRRFAALVLVGCEPLFPDVEDWIGDSETLARRFDARLGDLQECLEEDDCGEVLDSEESVFAMCSWVGSRGELAPERFEAAEWPRFDGLCEGLEGVLAMPSADALRRIEELRVETDRISEGIRDDIEPREREEAERGEG